MTRSSDDLPTAPFPFDFEARAPTGPLSRYVESLWYARGTIPYTREKIAPTGSTVAVFVLGDPIIETASNGESTPLVADRGFLIGPHDRPVINEPTGETYALGIVTTPVGCEAVFGLRPNRLRGKVFDLCSIWPRAGKVRDALLANASSKRALLDQLEAALPFSPPKGVDRCAAAVAMLEADPTRPIADIASAVGLSHSHLDREFSRITGMTPRILARLLRVRALLLEIDINGNPNWGALAAEFGWFDQAHLIRDFKRHTGVTPEGYLRAQRATYTPVEAGDAAGFVPETS